MKISDKVDILLIDSDEIENRNFKFEREEDNTSVWRIYGAPSAFEASWNIPKW